MLRWSKQDKILKISSLEYIVICIQFRWFHIHGIQLITVYRFLYSLDFGYCICGLKLRRMEVPERSYFLHHLRQSGDRVWVKTSMFFEEKIKTQQKIRLFRLRGLLSFILVPPPRPPLFTLSHFLFLIIVMTILKLDTFLMHLEYLS